MSVPKRNIEKRKIIEKQISGTFSDKKDPCIFNMAKDMIIHVHNIGDVSFIVQLSRHWSDLWPSFICSFDRDNTDIDIIKKLERLPKSRLRQIAAEITSHFKYIRLTKTMSNLDDVDHSTTRNYEMLLKIENNEAVYIDLDEDYLLEIAIEFKEDDYREIDKYMYFAEEGEEEYNNYDVAYTSFYLGLVGDSV